MIHIRTKFFALRAVVCVLCAVFISPISAQKTTKESNSTDSLDSLEISLLTCQPHDEIYSLYGHTAIHFHDKRNGKAINAAFNYGVFNFHAPLFVLRFVFGLTDYELGAYPYSLFVEEYQQLGCMVTEQLLNLTNEEKECLRLALGKNLQPGNNVYRYNYFYNNCTTKARDIIEQSISGKIIYSNREDFSPTYREMIHEMTRNNPWARFGNDLLLGLKADRETTRCEQEFLPHNLMYDFDHAQIYANGQYRPLVKKRQTAVAPGVQLTHRGFPLTPQTCCNIILGISLLLLVLEWRSKRTFLVWDLLLMMITGIIGIILFLMLFSQHPTVSLNLQLLFFNPLPWFFLWPVVKRKKTHYWIINVLLYFLFLIGALFQTYAEGIISLASCLLLQSCIHLYLNRCTK